MLRNMDFIWQGMEGFSDRSWVSLAAEWVRKGSSAGRGPSHYHRTPPMVLHILGSHLYIGVCEMVGAVANHPIGC